MEQNRDAQLGLLSTEHTYHRAMSGLLLLLLSQAQEDEAGALPLPAVALSIRQTVRDMVFSLDTLLEDAAQKADALETCIALKADVLTLYQQVYAYFAALGILSDPINDQMALRRYRDEGIGKKQLDFSGFLSDCATLLDSAENRMEQLQLQGALLKCAPLRMTRDRYFDLLQKALDEAFMEETEAGIRSMLSTLKRAAAPDQTPGFEELYPEISGWVAEKQAVKFTDLSEDALDEIYTDLQGLWESLTRVSDQLQALYADINTLILLLSLSFSFADLTERDLGYADSFQALREVVTGELEPLEAEAIQAQLVDRLEAILSPLLDKANEFGKQVKDLLTQEESLDGLSEDTAKALLTESFVLNLFYSDLADDLFDKPQEGVPASPELRLELCHSFLGEMRTYFTGLASTVRKPAMQVLLAALPIPMTPQEVVGYIQYALDNSVSVEDKILIVDKAGVLLDEHGFYQEEEEADEEHHHHHDCDCGHEHHHHDCDCGHEHHHHDCGHHH